MIRRQLNSMLSEAANRSDWLEVAMVASWVDVLEVIDRWIEEAAPLDLDTQLTQVEQLPSPERFDGLRAIVPDLSAWASSPRRRATVGACVAVRQSGVPREICRAAEETFETLNVDDPDCAAVVDQLAGSVRFAGESMAVPVHEGAWPLRRAVRLLDHRLHMRLTQLPAQASWLAQCNDIWTNPGAMVVVSGIIEDSRRRRGLANLATASFWSEADTDLKRNVLECVQAVQDGTDDAGIHARVRSIGQQWGDVPRLALALEAIAWPTDPLDRMHWSPPPEVEIETGRLLERLRARAESAERRDMWAWRRTSMEVEAAARAVLASLRVRELPE
jgi:hypothetical protein